MTLKHLLVSSAHYVAVACQFQFVFLLIAQKLLVIGFFEFQKAQSGRRRRGSGRGRRHGRD